MSDQTKPFVVQEGQTFNPAGATILHGPPARVIHKGGRVSDVEAKQSTQKTPQGAEIPVPTREDFLSNLEKVSRPDDD